MKTEGREFRRLRKEAGLSQRELAERLGWSTPQFVSNIERGVAVIPPRHFKKLGRVMKVDPTVFVEAQLKDVRAELESYL